MSINTSQLTHPEFMSNEKLLQVLKGKCIQVPSEDELLDRDALVELYTRIALPLPQRDYGHTRHINRRMSFLRASKSIPVAQLEENLALAELIDNTEKLGRLKPTDDNCVESNLCDNSQFDDGNMKRRFHPRIDVNNCLCL